jgi:hypothetical protein
MSTTTIIEQARQAVDGFTDLYDKTGQKLSLTGYSGSTSNNYLRELARISLHFGTTPDKLSEDQINEYLQGSRQNMLKSSADG